MALAVLIFSEGFESYLIVHLLIRIVTEYASNKKVTSSTDLDIGVKETGLAANKDENVDKVAHTSPVIGNQKSKLGLHCGILVVSNVN